MSLRGDWGKNFVKKKYLDFNYVIPVKQKIKLGDKTGEDKIINKKPKTIRDFLKDEWNITKNNELPGRQKK